MADYRMTFDLHTHTAIRKAAGQEILHAKGTVEENVRAAAEKGLTAIGISNHGPGHVTYGLPVDCIPTLLGEIHEAQARYPEIKIYFGVEANIINASGKLDVEDEDYDRFDYVMAGYHYGIFGETPLRAALIHACNWLYERADFVRDLADDITLGGSDGDETGTERLTRINTQLMTEAILKNRLRVLTHPGDKGPFDIDAVAKACAATGTWMEINNSHRDLTVEGIQTAAKYDVKFVIGSDAHCPDCVGLFENGLDRALRAGLSPDRIVNIEPVSGGWAMRTGLLEITAKRNTDIPGKAEPNVSRPDEEASSAEPPNRPEPADEQSKAAASEPPKTKNGQILGSDKLNDAVSEMGILPEMAAAVFSGLEKTEPVPDKPRTETAPKNMENRIAADELSKAAQAEIGLSQSCSDADMDKLKDNAYSMTEQSQAGSIFNTARTGEPRPEAVMLDESRTATTHPDPTQSSPAAPPPDPTQSNSAATPLEAFEAQPFEWAWNSSAPSESILNTDKQEQGGGPAKGPRRYPIHASNRHRDMKAVLTARRQTMK